MADTQSATSKLLTKQKKSTQTEGQAEDFITTVAHEIENLDHEGLLAAADQLVEEGGSNDFKLGGLLAKIQEDGLFEGYDSFRALVENRYGLNYRKAMYLIAIYNALVGNSIPWEKVKNLGWTKLKEIASLLNSANVDEWVAKAQALTVLQLQEAVKQHNAAGPTVGGDANEGNEVTSTVTTLTFKVHEDQKSVVREALDKAKADTNTEYDTVALANICTGYLGGSVNIATTGTQKTLKDLMEEADGFEKVLEVFEQVFPTVDLTVAT